MICYYSYDISYMLMGVLALMFYPVVADEDGYYYHDYYYFH